MKAAVPFYNTNGNIYADKWRDGTRTDLPGKHKVVFFVSLFSFLSHLSYSQVSLMIQVTAPPMNLSTGVKRMGVKRKTREKPKCLFWQQPAPQAD